MIGINKTKTDSVNSRLLSDDVLKLTKYEDLQKVYNELKEEESRINAGWSSLLQKKDEFDVRMESLQSLIPNLQMVQNDAKQLAGMIAFTSTLAETVSGKVRQLDLAKSHVVHSIEVVEDVLDLKFCTDGVQIALQDEDYEKAAAHIHRFLSLDENVLRLSADTDEGSTLDQSFKLLNEAHTKLKSIIHNKFDAAVRCGDAASVERFFKTFPLIGEKKAGLEKFSKYLCAQLSDTSDKNLKLALAVGPNDKRANVIYADTVTLLFEAIARMIDIHQPLVETYYGHGWLISLVEFLQKECDRQVKAIIQHFKTNRGLDQKEDVKLLPFCKKMLDTTCVKKGIQHLKNSHNTDMSVLQVQQSLNHRSSVERIDAKEIDGLLTEIALLSTRAELYIRFLRRRIHNDIEVAVQDDDKVKERKQEVDNFVNGCQLSCVMQELIGQYILMEEYFMRQMISKAVSMDQTEDGALTSSMVDDVFFIVKKSVRRGLSSSSVDGVCAMLNHATTILDEDLREVLFGKLRAGFPSGSFDLVQAYNLVQSSITQGRLQSADTEAEKTRAAFLVTMNNSEVSCEHIQTLQTNIQEELEKLYSQVSPQGKAKLQSCLTDLGLISSHFKDVLEFGFSQLITGAIKLRVKPCIDAFLVVDHNISEEQFSVYEVNDPWIQNFISVLDGLLTTFKAALTTSNYDTLVSHVCNEITAQLEQALIRTTFNRLGGLQFDKELRALVNYLTSVTTWTIRDKFARLTQMATIVNLEKVTEILDYWGSNSGPLTWRLTPAEVRQILLLRVDFKPEEVKKLKL